MLLRLLLLFGTTTFSKAETPQYGLISSPDYPKTYPDNQHITWNVTVNKGFHISLKFLVFDLKPSKQCKYDYVKVFDENREMGWFCGSNMSSSHPGRRLFTSHGNRMKLEFLSDFSNEENCSAIFPTGFQAFYQAVDDDECASPSDKSFTWTPPCQQICHNYIGGYFCTCLLGYKLQSDNRSCKAVNCGDPDRIDNGDVDFTQTTYRAKAVYNCKTEYYTLQGYDTFYCSMDGLWINSNEESELPKCKAVCGKSSVSTFSRIFGGKQAEEGYFPWLVRIDLPSGFGVGSLIWDRWVVTAADVVEEYGKPTLKVGDVDREKATTIHVKKVIIHPDWTKVDDNEGRTNYNNDIALIQLARRIELDECIYPVCLPQRGETAGPAISEVGYIAGWGEAFQIINQTRKRTMRPKRLRYTRVPLRDPEDCKKKVPNIYTITSNMLCAGEEGHDNCRGDAGGPLMFEDLQNRQFKRLYIAGIVSFGPRCGKLGIYTKVQNYVDWIEKTIEKVENEEKDEEQPEPLKICKKKTAEGV